MLDLELIDVQETKFDFESKYPGKSVTEEELVRVPYLRNRLKNAVLHHIVNRRNREQSSSLKEILDRATQTYRKKKVKEA